MQHQTRVVISGGGAAEASVLYHLSNLGCSDAIVLQRSELISGSTWHAAGSYALSAGKSIAQSYVTKDIVNHDIGWSIELLGENLAAKQQKFLLFDANAGQMRS